MVFETTRWSLIARANDDGESVAAAKALDELCGIYWPAVYALYRADGMQPDAARDLTQGLFTHLLERRDFGRADPERGRFRAFLRTAAQHWASNARRAERAGKRGGDVRTFTVDTDGEEERRSLEPLERLDAAAIFERRWAQAVIEQALAELEQEERSAGRDALWPYLRPALEGTPQERSWAELAAELATTEGALRVAAHRLRQRFRARLEAEVRDTLADPEAHGEELEELLRALRQ